ncbi:MAG: haloacid dehalogenase-like hydrolase [Candidatus Bipolaricaulota bacterium]|nr:haloacid dehalogenase-like hydrolase [Candidatus Bipolaricaulota bacterium]
MARAQFVTDLEGPLTLNDNAFELAAHFLPNGAHFFALISRYDDVLADVIKRAGYRAGNTLKLIVPFLKAFGLRDRDLQEFSRTSIKLVPGAREALQRIRAQMPAFIISTSYEPYVRAVCDALDFPFENAYCTRISLDVYALSGRERQELLTLYNQIVQHSQIKIPPGAHSLDELSGGDRQTIGLLDHIFWERLWGMEIGRVLREVQPIGGPEKARALREISERTGISLARTIYVGDSITDVEALALVRQAGGLAVAFNGNRYALRAAELGCVSPDALILAEIAEAFQTSSGLFVVPPAAARCTVQAKPGIDEAFIQRSEQMRRRLRGEQIGGLG